MPSEPAPIGADARRALEQERADLQAERARVAATLRDSEEGVGSSVTVRYGDGTEETLEIGERAEASDQELITAEGPLGRALLGRRPGDMVTYDTPEGRTTAAVVSLGGAAAGRTPPADGRQEGPL
ncbi:GreA/GreB family elongation factor [Streptomyces flaveolus]|uniref:GreA/GreB family elongation factor n=1 Tax=Streptomyces flaveolus TaxID=67297 RepID=UPI00342CF598